MHIDKEGKEEFYVGLFGIHMIVHFPIVYTRLITLVTLAAITQVES